MMKNSIVKKKLAINLFGLILLFSGVQSANAACVSGSVTLRAPLYIVTVDASRLLTYLQKIGTVVKKAVLRKDCVGYTSYTISGTQNLPYSDGAQLMVIGKNDFTSPTPKVLTLKVINGSVDSTVTASGTQTGINSDPFSIYLNSTMVMRVKQSWK